MTNCEAADAASARRGRNLRLSEPLLTARADLLANRELLRSRGLCGYVGPTGVLQARTLAAALGAARRSAHLPRLEVLPRALIGRGVRVDGRGFRVEKRAAECSPEERQDT